MINHASYMIYSKTLAYFVVPCLVLFLLACGLLVLSVVRKKERLFDICSVSAVILFAGMIVALIIPTYNDNDVAKGELWSQCKLLEENAFNGTFSENVSKIECSGVIKNIPVSVYEKSLHAYHMHHFYDAPDNKLSER